MTKQRRGIREINQRGRGNIGNEKEFGEGGSERVVWGEERLMKNKGRRRW